MAKPSDTSPNSPSSSSPETPTPPAQHIWLAGLGAMAKAQEQGTKAIEALVNDGLAFQRKSQAEAQQRLQEATERLTHMASDLGQPPLVRVDRLEHLFEERVAKALHRLGMPTMHDVQRLNERITELQTQLAQVLPKPPAATAPSQPKTKARPSVPDAPASAKAKPRSAPAKTTRRTAG